ncbi:MAG: hypothetical protein ACLP29_14290 [Dissulfurispiraceae bacterium]|jgi:hypothetical protein
MISCFKKKQIFGLALVLYFSIYAASPLLYTGVNQKSPEGLRATKTEAAYRTDLHIYLYELICSTFVSKSGKETSNPIAVILLLKTRAVLSEDKASTLIHLADMAMLDTRLMFSNNPSVPISMHGIYNAYENSPRLFSGLSPPQPA